MIEKEIVICMGLAQESSGGSGGGTGNYSDLTNKPKINGNIVVGDKTGSQLGLQNELTAGQGIAIETDQQTGETTISATGVTAIDDELSTTSELPVQNKVITNALNGKVDKETGKGLSANDFTDTLKNKLDNIESNAEVNTISTISCNNTPVSPDANKNVNITVPVNTSDLNNDNNTVTDANYVHTDNNYTTAEKEKLANLGTASQKDYTTQITQNSEDLITSGAVYTGLGLKLDTSLKGVAEGLAELDENGKIVTSQLPASIDEIIEGYFYEGAFYQDQQHTVVITGQTNKIYVDLVSNKTYRWGGSAYVEISESLAIGETSSTAGRGDYTKTAYDHSQLVAGNPHNVTKAEVGLGNCDNTSDLNKPISTATQTALNGKIGTGLLPAAETNIKAIDSYMLASDLNITDANDIKYKYGVVCCNGQNVSHLPSTDYYNVHVEIVNNDPNKIIQTAIKNSSPVETYVRRSTDLGSTWSAWSNLATTDDINSKVREVHRIPYNISMSSFLARFTQVGIYKGEVFIEDSIAGVSINHWCAYDVTISSATTDAYVGSIALTDLQTGIVYVYQSYGLTAFNWNLVNQLATADGTVRWIGKAEGLTLAQIYNTYSKQNTSMYKGFLDWNDSRCPIYGQGADTVEITCYNWNLTAKSIRGQDYFYDDVHNVWVKNTTISQGTLTIPAQTIQSGEYAEVTVPLSPSEFYCGRLDFTNLPALNMTISYNDFSGLFQDMKATQNRSQDALIVVGKAIQSILHVYLTNYTGQPVTIGNVDVTYYLEHHVVKE